MSVEKEDLPFGSLAEGPQPPDDLEERTVRALRQRGLIGSRSAPGRSGYLKFAAALVAAVLLYGAGFLSRGMIESQNMIESPRKIEPPRAAGTGVDAPTDTVAPTGMAATGYMLLLWESDAMFAESQAAGPALAQEYAAWARDQAGQGRLLGGEEVGVEARFVRRDDGSLIEETALQSPEQQNLSGFFLIAASGEDELLEIAADCPHLAHGGTIEIRPIVRR